MAVSTPWVSSGQAFADAAEHAGGGYAGLGEGDFGGPATVLRRVGAARDAGGFGVDQEQGDAVRIAPVAAGAGGDDEGIRGTAAEDDGFFAFQEIVRAVRPGGEAISCKS